MQTANGCQTRVARRTLDRRRWGRRSTRTRARRRGARTSSSAVSAMSSTTCASVTDVGADEGLERRRVVGGRDLREGDRSGLVTRHDGDEPVGAASPEIEPEVVGEWPFSARLRRRARRIAVSSCDLVGGRPVQDLDDSHGRTSVAARAVSRLVQVSAHRNATITTVRVTDKLEILVRACVKRSIIHGWSACSENRSDVRMIAPGSRHLVEVRLGSATWSTHGFDGPPVRRGAVPVFRVHAASVLGRHDGQRSRVLIARRSARTAMCSWRSASCTVVTTSSRSVPRYGSAIPATRSRWRSTCRRSRGVRQRRRLGSGPAIRVTPPTYSVRAADPSVACPCDSGP